MQISSFFCAVVVVVVVESIVVFVVYAFEFVVFVDIKVAVVCAFDVCCCLVGLIVDVFVGFVDSNVAVYVYAVDVDLLFFFILLFILLFFAVVVVLLLLLLLMMSWLFLMHFL